MVVYLPNLKQICQGKKKCAVLFLRGVLVVTFGSLIFHLISILVKALWTKKDNSQSGAYLYFFFNSFTHGTYFSSFPPPASSDFSVIFHRISFKRGRLIDSNMFIRWLHFRVGRSNVKVRERRKRKKTAISLSFLIECLSKLAGTYTLSSRLL